jgi:ATP-binding cassette subfamily B protein
MRIKLRWPRIPLSDVRQVFAHFGHHLQPHRGKLMAGGACLLGTALVEVTRPWPLKIIFDYILLPKRNPTGGWLLSPLNDWTPMAILALASGAILIIAALAGLFSYAQSIILSAVGQQVVGAIRLQLFSHIQRLPQSYHDQRETGDLMVRMTGDLSLIKDLMVSTLLNLGSRIVILIGMLGAMLWMDSRLTLIALAVIPILVLANTRFSGRIKRASRRQRRKEGVLATSIHESFTGIGLIKVFAQERNQEKQFSKSVSSDVRAGMQTTRLEAAFSRTVDIITALGTCVVLWFGVRRVLSNDLSAGDLLIFISYMRLVYRPLRDMANLSTKISKAVVSGQRIIEVLEIEAPVEDDPSAVSADLIAGDIRFDNLTFSYHPGHPVLHSVTCAIPAGYTTAIIGPSGAGKSTIAKLLLRLYEPTEGRILIDGRDIREYRTRSLRKKITSLTQDITMFHASIRENIGFGKPKAGFDEIVAAACKVGADEFIKQLPNGYDTIVGEGGLTVSGGQRQRLAFARAALRDSPIMIFDEPATGLDAVAERESKEALAALRAGRTLIIVTHRLNFLDLADHVLLIDGGRVVEEGSPRELTARRGPLFDYVQRWFKEVAVGRPAGPVD